MEKISEKRVILKWKKKGFGLFEATIWNDELTDFRACENGSKVTFNSSNIRFLADVRDAINDLLKEIGYKDKIK